MAASLPCSPCATSCSMPLQRICAMRPPACGAMSTDSAPSPIVSSGPGASGESAPTLAGATTSSAIGLQGADAPFGIVLQLGDLGRAQVGDAAGKQGVVVVEPPAPLELQDRMVRGPADHRFEDAAAIGERPIRVVRHRPAQQMGVAGGVGQVIAALVPVYPGGLEE